ncbi:YybS family protein [Bacillus sp. CGMCC 1.16541]|uniref:YybS family protein n=1 Tax=Bacillus sp. CGMCC 1.16541 TaxID=2185143 RepID=UPI000D72679A|nr:YybS family protein [Bacillus sp. CGMCC 1.16541]
MKGTRFITEGAMLLAILVGLLLFSLYIPIIGQLFMLSLAVPFIIFTVRHGVKKSVVFFIVSLLLGLLFGRVVALPTVFAFGVSGVFMGYLYSQQKNRYVTLLGGTVAFSINLLLLYVVVNVLFKIDLMQLMEQTLNESMEMSKNTLEMMGQTANEQQVQQLEQAVDIIKYMFPSIIVMMSFVFAFFTQLIATPILKRLQYKVEKFPPFHELKLPKSILWYYLLVLILSFFDLQTGSFLFIAVVNLLMVLQTLILIQGYSFIFYFCRQKGYSKAIAIMVVVLSIIPIVLQFVRILGIIDLGFDLRKKQQK